MNVDQWAKFMADNITSQFRRPGRQPKIEDLQNSFIGWVQDILEDERNSLIRELEAKAVEQTSIRGDQALRDFANTIKSRLPKRP